MNHWIYTHIYLLGSSEPKKNGMLWRILAMLLLVAALAVPFLMSKYGG